jgi:hypothetical protein
MPVAAVLILSIGLAAALAKTPTVAAQAGSVTIAAAGDIAPPNDPGPNATATANLIAMINPTAVLVLGDNVYPDGSLVQYQRSYDQAWGAFKAKTYPAPGNHEQKTNLSGYCSYFGSAAHCSGAYYSYDLGSWHFVVLNSAGGSIPSNQIAFLQNDLAADNHLCELVYWHHPRWSSGEHGSYPFTRNAWAAAVGGGVDLVLNGHDHDYERFRRMDANGLPSVNGTREIIVGTGGRSLSQFGAILPTSQQHLSEYGVLKLSLSGSAYSWAFINIAGTTRDSGATACH